MQGVIRVLNFSQIESRRQQYGIEQKVLAERAGMKPQAYSKLKRPGGHGPTEQTLRKLNAALEALAIGEART